MKIGIRFFYCSLVILIISSCSGTRFLEPGEEWLFKQEIKGIKKANVNEVRDQITLTPNTRIPLIGPLGAVIYESGENALDTAKINTKRSAVEAKYNTRIRERSDQGKSTRKLESKLERKLERYDKILRLGNTRMRTGSPLAIYDSIQIEDSRKRIEAYLRNKGFRETEVTTEKRVSKKKVSQAFIIEEGPRSYIDSLEIRTVNPLIARLIEDFKKDSYLKKGEFFDRQNLELERNRLDLLMRDHGYFDFSTQYIEFNIFYAPESTDLWVITIINQPDNNQEHKYYDLDSIIVNANGNQIITNTIDYKGVKYNYGAVEYAPKVLDSRLIIEPDKSYNYTDAVNTQKQLLNMDMFRFVNLNFDTTLIPGKFVANVYTAPLQRFQLTQELGVNVNEGFPGPFYNVSLRNRNTFQGAEILELNGFIGAEGVAAASEQSGFYRSFQYGGNLSLTFPRFMTPFQSRRLNKSTFNPKSRVSLGFAFTDRPEYRRSNLNGTYAYTWQNIPGTKTYTLNVADVNLIDTDINPASGFQQQLDELEAQGNTLNLSFNRSFVSSTSFNATYNFNYGAPNVRSSFLRLFLESGGTIYDIIGTGLLDNNSLEFYQFAKIQIDYRRFIPLRDEKSLSLRANTGVAIPYGDNRALPYEKFFFSGGSNSNRAWNPRRLGPGSSFPYLLDEFGQNVRDENGELVPNRTGVNSFQFEQPGEILLDLSLEYRANIQSFVDWAFFIDAGNIWRIDEFQAPDPGEVVRVSSGGQFELNRFYKELAVGAGLGLRLDFSFLVFRFDVGHKIRDPRFPEGQRWQRLFTRRGQTVWNIAVGYPF